MNVLFASSSSSDYSSSYTYRLLQLKAGVEKFGVHSDILYLGDYFFSTPPLLQPFNIPLFRRLVKGYEIVHASGTPAAYVLGLSKPFIKSKILYDVHGDAVKEACLIRRGIFDFRGNYRILESKTMELIATKYSDFFITCSRRLKQEYIRKGIEEDRIEVIENAVNIELFKPAHMGPLNKKFIVAYAGGFQKWQGVENLLAAAKLIDSTDIRFRIIGFTAKYLGLKKKIWQELSPKVELIGKLTQTELVNQLRRSDILIIPRSRHPANEVAFPTKFAEYVAVGKPVIVTRVDETAELVEKYDCGFVCEPTPEAITNAILKAKQTPREELNQKGINSRRLAEIKLNQEIVSERYFKFLCRIMEAA